MSVEDGEYRSMPTNVKGLLGWVKQIKAKNYAKHPFITGCATKKEAIAKLEELLAKGVTVI